MERDSTLHYVAFEDLRGPGFRSQFGTSEWIIVDASVTGKTEDISIGAALLPAGVVEHALANADWDLLPGHGGTPTHSVSVAPDRDDIIKYERFGN